MKINLHGMGYEPTDLHVTISELRVATADQSDEMLGRSINDVLKTLRDRLPFPIGTHISARIVLKSGEVYGTLCSFLLRPA